jgi:hypothetical protein
MGDLKKCAKNLFRVFQHNTKFEAAAVHKILL